MTFEQLMSPVVLDWIYKSNDRLNESNGELTLEQIDEEFDVFFREHLDEINASVSMVNESRFSKLADQKRAEEAGVEFEDVPVSGKIEDAENPNAMDEVELEKESEGISTDSHVRFKVRNYKKGSTSIEEPGRRNVFNAVNAIYDKMERDGKLMAKNTPLRYVDVSEVVDMTALFAFTNMPNADLSSWGGETGNVTTMEGMFYKSTFNNDSICKWNVSSCLNFSKMFHESKFNQSLKMWRTAEDPKTGLPIALPYVGAARDEEEAMMNDFFDNKFNDFEYDDVRESAMKHVMDFDAFMLNESRLGDIVKKGVDKVKDFFKSAAIKLNNFFVANVGEDGEVLDVVSPETTINYLAGGNVAGVSVYSSAKSENINDGVVETAEELTDDESYPVIDENSNEYKNYMTFLKMLSESPVTEGVININYDDIKADDNTVNEERVPLNGEKAGIVVPDIDTAKLEKEIKMQMLYTPKNKKQGALKPILIWGAPGVGKSTIPNAIIKAYNKAVKYDPTKMKSLIVAECGEMTPDGFSLPLPEDLGYEKMTANRPQMRKLSDSLGLSEKDWEGFTVRQSGDAPKIWLPCYKPNTDMKKNEVLKAIANGGVVEYYDEDGEYHVSETCDGGIIMFDEFMRADTSIFNIVMQILLNRAYQGFVLGDAWALIACSNRPFDDSAIKRQMMSISPVAMNRFRQQYNFVPSFDKWKKWAISPIETGGGGFDEFTLAFLTSREESGEYVYWHTVDPDLNAEGHSTHPTPRSWSELMRSLHAECEVSGYTSIVEIPQPELEEYVFGAIGKEVGREYVKWLKERCDGILVSEIFKNPGYVNKTGTTPVCADLCERIKTYVYAHWSKDDLPEESELINMTNFMQKLYSIGKKNIVLQLHEDIIRHLDIALMLGDEMDKDIHPDTWDKYAEYGKLIDKYYPVKNSEL